jgi:hypothetical protein
MYICLIRLYFRCEYVEIGDCWSANSVTVGGQITEDDLA